MNDAEIDIVAKIICKEMEIIREYLLMLAMIVISRKKYHAGIAIEMRPEKPLIMGVSFI